VQFASIVIAITAVLFAWQQAASASRSLAQSEKLSIEFDKQGQQLALLNTSITEKAAQSEELSSIVADHMQVVYQKTMAELASDKKLLNLLCPSELTEVSLRLDCDIRHVDFSAKAVNALVWFTTLSDVVAEKADIDKQGAIETVCAYQSNNISALFNAGDYVLGVANYVPFQ